ncbi:MAG: hypothetical protein VB076_07455 [Synergistaceae bacterium]|nr:hypothetical protein [Synergistaceae bacterium]
MAFFRMELRSINTAMLDCRSKLIAIYAGHQYIIIIIANRMIRMNEIISWKVFDFVQNFVT